MRGVAGGASRGIPAACPADFRHRRRVKAGRERHFVWSSRTTQLPSFTEANMPPAKRTTHEDARSDASTVRERQIAAAAHARSKKQGTATAAVNNGSALKELALVSTESGSVVVPGQTTGVGDHSHGPVLPKTLLTDSPRCNGIRPTANFSTPIAFHTA